MAAIKAAASGTSMLNMGGEVLSFLDLHSTWMIHAGFSLPTGIAQEKDEPRHQGTEGIGIGWRNNRERERDADTRTCSKAHLCFDFASIDWIGMMENVGILHMVWW